MGFNPGYVDVGEANNTIGRQLVDDGANRGPKLLLGLQREPVDEIDIDRVEAEPSRLHHLLARELQGLDAFDRLLDLGLEVLPAPTMRFEARGFVNRIDDVIVDNVVSQNPSQTRSVNAGNATAWGLELALDHGLSEKLRWFVNGTLVPDWMANLGASVTVGGRVVVSPYLRAVGTFYDSSSTSGRQEFGSYVVPALRVEGTIDTGAGSSAVLALDLNNLTDERYEMPWQFRDPGFNAFGSVTLRLP